MSRLVRTRQRGINAPWLRSQRPCSIPEALEAENHSPSPSVAQVLQHSRLAPVVHNAAIFAPCRAVQACAVRHTSRFARARCCAEARCCGARERR